MRTREDERETKDRIVAATIKVFNQKGLKFTMDDLAAELSMSKKTIYTVFDNKESMFTEMVEYCFDKIKESEQRVLEDTTLSTVGKIRKILGVLPDGYSEINFSQLYTLKEKYPEIYQQVESRLETGWENTIELLNQGMDEGVIRPINVVVIKTMLEATLEQFFKRDVLVSNDIKYSDALAEVVDILVDGITVSKEK